MTISKPTSAHWSIALRTASGRPWDVHDDRVLRDPRRDGAIHAAHRQAFALAVVAVVDQNPGAETFERFARRDIGIRAERGLHSSMTGA